MNKILNILQAYKKAGLEQSGQELKGWVPTTIAEGSVNLSAEDFLLP